MKNFKLHFGHWLFKLPIIRSYDGLVLGRHIFTKSKAPKKTLVHHELWHQKQMDAHGVIGFYLIYLKDYVFNLFRFGFNHNKAYRNIPFEAEAYANQGKGNPYERVG